MRLGILVALTMVAFAANSVLTRAAVLQGMDVAAFGVIRLLSGTAVLLWLSLRQGHAVQVANRLRAVGAFGLVLYIFGFTAAYRGMDSGFGALLLFGTVQVTMFAGAAFLGERITPARTVGGAVALAGLLYLVWPWQGIASGWLDIAMMLMAGFGWGIYSLVGRWGTNALGDTAVHFLLASVVGVALFPFLSAAPLTQAPLGGVVLACISGAITSGLGYALWYAVLPRVGATMGAVAQLTVPPIAMLGGVLLLGETLTIKFFVAALIILGGIAIAVAPWRSQTR